MASRKLIFILVFVALAFGIAIGVLIGYFSAPKNDDSSSTKDEFEGLDKPASFYKQIAENGDESIFQKMIDEIKAENIRENLRYMTLEPHVAGTPEDKESAEYLRDEWKKQGLDEAVIIPYDILLSYPGNKSSNDTANKAQILNADGSVYFQTPLEEAALDEAVADPRVLPPFNAYAANGTVESDELIYVNYARIEDFHWLERNMSILVKDKIVVARYGKIYRGDKVRHAWMFGAKCILLYSDPKDYAFQANGSVFPDSWWLPGTGVQRGSTFLGNGDPLTPGYPSTPYSYRSSIEDLGDTMPKIPSHPIGYDYAREFFNEMNGTYGEVPESWRGDMPGVSYTFGGKMKGNRKVRVEVNNVRERRIAYNTIGVIRGAIEPDRYVIIGNHRDAWAYGAVDPTSGTATLKEITRSLGGLHQKGWKPRRTLLFCSWGAEEYGLIGSTEWVEENMKNLAERAVLYINIDIAVEYKYTLHAAGSPLLHKAIYSRTKMIPDPEPNFKSVYESWSQRSTKNDDNEPKIGGLGSGSDYAPFYQRIGAPAIDLSYTYDDKKWPISSYPLYHSVYETLQLVTNFTDPSFKWHQALGRLAGELGRYFAEEALLPMDVSSYAVALERMLGSFKKSYEDILNKQNISLNHLENAVKMLKEKATSFMENLKKVNVYDPYAVRRVNDQMMLFERAFTDPLGLPGRKYAKHVIFAPSSKNTYASSSFPGLSDALFDIEALNDKQQMKQWEIVKQQLSVVTYTITSAATTIDDVAYVKRLDV